MLRRLKFERIVPQEVGDLFHQLRIAGNRATHSASRRSCRGAELPQNCPAARHLVSSDFPGAPFSAGPFVPPPDPSAATEALHNELERLRAVVDETRTEAEHARRAAAPRRVTGQAPKSAHEKRRRREPYGNSSQVRRSRPDLALTVELQAIQAAAVTQPGQTTAALVAQGRSCRRGHRYRRGGNADSDRCTTAGPWLGS